MIERRICMENNMKTTGTRFGLLVLWMMAGLALPHECAAQAAAPGAAQANAAVAQPGEAVMALLKALEAAGDQFTTVKTDITYTVVSPTLGDRETRVGYVLYDAAKGDKPARFRIHFDTRQDDDGPRVKNVMDYAFDGRQWMYIADHANKKLQQLQTPENVNPLRLGEGPFPLPFGQKVDDVLEFFDAATRDPLPADPPNTQYLKLTPKADKADKMNFTEIEEWVDNKTNLPVKLVVREKNKTVSTVLFGKREGDKVVIDTQPKIKDADFKLEKPTGWQLEIIRLDEKK